MKKAKKKKAKKKKPSKNNYAESNKYMKWDKIDWAILSSMIPKFKLFAESIGLKISSKQK